MILINEIQEILSMQTELVLDESEEYYLIEGYYSYNLIKFNNTYKGRTRIKIRVEKDFPNSIPTVYLYDAPSNMEHMYDDKSACLASYGEIIMHLCSNKSLVDFITYFIDPYIYTMKWFEEYGTYIFGERPHGVLGLLEFYSESYGLNYESYVKMCTLISKGKYRGHCNCFCNSGKKMRNCHGGIVMTLIENEQMKEKILIECDYIKDYFYKLKIAQIQKQLNNGKGQY